MHSSYRRPTIEPQIFTDAEGVPIAYGDRWAGQPPPEETYSVVSHPERYAPLLVVAEALIAYLAETFDVTVDNDRRHAGELMHPVDDVVGATRVSANDPRCASLTFVYTSFPGVFVHAGVLHDFCYPDCGCDACDSTWESEATDLESTVLAVAAGSYREGMQMRSPESCQDTDNAGALLPPAFIDAGRTDPIEFGEEISVTAVAAGTCREGTKMPTTRSCQGANEAGALALPPAFIDTGRADPIELGAELWMTCSFAGTGKETASATYGIDLPPDRRQAAARALEAVPNGWAAWPLRNRNRPD